jgi:hypothetical protein
MLQRFAGCVEGRNLAWRRQMLRATVASETSRRDPAKSAYECQSGRAAAIVRGPSLPYLPFNDQFCCEAQRRCEIAVIVFVAIVASAQAAGLGAFIRLLAGGHTSFRHRLFAAAREL